MKKIGLGIIGGIMLVGLVGCKPVNKTDDVKKEATTATKVMEKETTESDSSDGEKQVAIMSTWNDYLLDTIYQDNYIGNLSYNITDDMPDDKVKQLQIITKKLLEEDFKAIDKRSKEAEAKMKTLGLDEKGLASYLEKGKKQKETLANWRKELVSLTPENKTQVKEAIAKGQEDYLKLSVEMGQEMVKVLGDSDYSQQEAQAMAMGILQHVTQEAGDPSSLK